MNKRRSVLSVRDLIFRRSRAPEGFAVRLTTLDMAPGDRLALVGPSGSGKSTLLDLISLAMQPDQAAAFTVNGTKIMNLWAARQGDALAVIRGSVMGYVLQTGGLLPFLSVRRNIELTARLSGRLDISRVKSLCERLGIGHLLDRKPARISVGERQRVSIARALAHRPQIIFADEPTASVDRHTANAVMNLLMNAADQEGVAVVIASHDQELLDRFNLTRIPLDVSSDAAGTVTSFGRPRSTGSAA